MSEVISTRHINGLMHGAKRTLLIADPASKTEAVASLRVDDMQADSPPTDDLLTSGRPEQPTLVPPRLLQKRGLGSAAGRSALLHAVAHIEFNAINLALDAIWRFAGRPYEYYADWLSVAKDEARHFAMVCDRLEALGMRYGDLPAHDGLWTMCVKTRHSCLERMALVPRVLEARGLDVSPGMIESLERHGDSASADVLRVILDEEVRHVEIGTRWFYHECANEGREPVATFLDLIQRYMKGAVRGPFNREARLRAGFVAEELALLEADA